MIVIIPDNVFHKLWTIADKYETYDDYYNSVIGHKSKDFVNFGAINISPEQVFDVTKNIFNCVHMSLRDIYNEYEFSNASFAHAFCINKRTVEDWASGKIKMPIHIKLMVLELLKYQILPSGYRTESMNKFQVYEQIKNQKYEPAISDERLKEIDKEIEAIQVHTVTNASPITSSDTKNIPDNDLKTFSIKEFERTNLISKSIAEQ